VSAASFDALISTTHVLKAVMLRNIRTRFFGHGLGFLIALSWPLVHIALLLTISVVVGRIAPYGDSSVVFFATGLAPYMAYLYISRFMMISIQINRPLLAFPAVKILDLLIASAILEVLSSCCALIVTAVVLTSFGEDLMPGNPAQAAFAFCAAVLFGLACGVFNSLVLMALPAWMTVSILFNMAMYAAAGVFFLPAALPLTVQYYLSFNPLFQIVEWMRSAYYDGYGLEFLDKRYVVGFSLTLLFLGLIVERVFRGRFLIK
jgi:capsular polysaccharide transport system permease protein